MVSVPPRSRWQEATIKIRLNQYFNEFVDEETSEDEIAGLLKKYVKKNKKEFKLWDYLAGVHGEATVLHYSTRDAFLKHMEFLTRSVEEQKAAEEKVGFALKEAEEAEKAALEAEQKAKEAEEKLKAAIEAKKVAAAAALKKAEADKVELKQKMLEMKKQKMAMKAEARKEIALARKIAKDEMRAEKYHKKPGTYLLAKEAKKMMVVNDFRMKLWESIQAGWTEEQDLTKAQKDLIHKVYYHRAVLEQVVEEVSSRIKFSGHLLKKGGDSGDKDLKERYFIVEDGVITYTEPHKVTGGGVLGKIDISNTNSTAKMGTGGKELIEKKHIHFSKHPKFTPEPDLQYGEFSFETDQDLEDNEKKVALAVAQQKEQEGEKEVDTTKELVEASEEETEIPLSYAEIITPMRTFWVYSDDEEKLQDFVDAVVSCAGNEQVEVDETNEEE